MTPVASTSTRVWHPPDRLSAYAVIVNLLFRTGPIVRRRAFVQKDKQERFVGFLANPRNRRKFTRSLPPFCWFDRRFATPITWKVDSKLPLGERHLQEIENIFRLLKSKGAGPTCWAISEDTGIDGRELDLGEALEDVIGNDTGTILSCVPGKLAYYEGEDEALLLAR